MSFNNASEVDSVKGVTVEKKNLQGAKGKVTTRFLWNACKALSIGLLLLTLGTTMAIVGYYADQLSIKSEMRGNSTVSVKNESRGFHLNNLSYAGPIIMGIGGFIVVAAWVMTFEARDNAAKVIPARFKITNSNSSTRKSTSRLSRFDSNKAEGKKNNSCQTVFGGRIFQGPCESEFGKSVSEWSLKNENGGKTAMKKAFAQFSRELLEKSINERSRLWRRKFIEANLNKYHSAPDLTTNISGFSNKSSRSPVGGVHGGHGSSKISPESSHKESGSREQDFRPSSMISKNLLLHPYYLQRQAYSIDSSFRENSLNSTPSLTRFSQWESGKSAETKKYTEMNLGSSGEIGGSQISMALDLHDYQVTLKVKDKSANKRSGTAKKHQLLRQKPVEEDREDREDRFLQHSHVPKFIFIPNSNDSIKAHNYEGFKNSASTQRPKMEKKSKSDLQCPFANENGVQQDDMRLFCVEKHLKKLNLSLENIKINSEDKVKCTRRHFSFITLQRSANSCECRFQPVTVSNVDCLTDPCKLVSHSESLFRPLSSSVPHTKKYPLVRSNAIRKKYNRKIKSSQSAEERSTFRNVSRDKMFDSTVRSASFSPTRQTCKNIFSSKNEEDVQNMSSM